MTKYGIIWILLLIASSAFSQQRYSSYIDGSDTLTMVHLPNVSLSVNVPEKSYFYSREYRKLKRDVKKVYPYALLAAEKLEYYNQQLEDEDRERKRKKVMKNVEKDLKEKYGDQLKKLTVTQGQILLKLIDRETGSSSYDLVKELRGTFSAMIFQTMAKFVGSDMRVRYDPLNEDRYIEHVVLLIEGGRL